MDPRIEEFLGLVFDGDVSNRSRGKSLVRTKQIIYYILYQRMIRIKVIADLMGTSRLTVYKGVKRIQNNLSDYEYAINRTKDLMNSQKYMDFLKHGLIPLNFLR